MERRELTGEGFHDGTIDALVRAFPKLTYSNATGAMEQAAQGRDRVTIHPFSEQLPKPWHEEPHRPSQSSPCRENASRF
jgi:hypothetical protein